MGLLSREHPLYRDVAISGNYGHFTREERSVLRWVAVLLPSNIRAFNVSLCRYLQPFY